MCSPSLRHHGIIQASDEALLWCNSVKAAPPSKSHYRRRLAGSNETLQFRAINTTLKGSRLSAMPRTTAIRYLGFACVCGVLSANSSFTTPSCCTTRRSTSRLRIAHTAGTAGLTYFTLTLTPKYQPHMDTHVHTHRATRRMLFKHTSTPRQAWVPSDPRDPSFYKEGFIPLFPQSFHSS